MCRACSPIHHKYCTDFTTTASPFQFKMTPVKPSTVMPQKKVCWPHFGFAKNVVNRGAQPKISFVPTPLTWKSNMRVKHVIVCYAFFPPLGNCSYSGHVVQPFIHSLVWQHVFIYLFISPFCAIDELFFAALQTDRRHHHHHRSKYKKNSNEYTLTICCCIIFGCKMP